MWTRISPKQLQMIGSTGALLAKWLLRLDEAKRCEFRDRFVNKERKLFTGERPPLPPAGAQSLSFLNLAFRLSLERVAAACALRTTGGENQAACYGKRGMAAVLGAMHLMFMRRCGNTKDQYHSFRTCIRYRGV